MAEPLTPPIISKLPLGLLGFLGIKSGGRYPENLVPALSPVWDMLELLGANHIQEVLITVPITALNFNVAAAGVPTVPQNEVWYVSQLGGTISTGVGDTVLAAVAADAYLLSQFATLAASQQNHWLQNSRIPCFLPPGSFVGVMVDAIVGAPLPDATINLRVSKMQI